jgi:hypothetical protein
MEEPFIDDATIRVFLTGVLELYFDPKPPYVIVGVNNQADGHRFTITVVPRLESASEAGFPLPVILEPSAPRQTIYLDVQRSGGTNGVSMFRPSESSSGVKEIEDPRDFKWVIVLDGAEFYDRPLHVRESVVSPPFGMNDGQFYTAFSEICEIRHGSESRRVRVAEVIGANIVLHQGDEARLLDGLSGELLNLTPGAGIRGFDVYVENSPAFPPDKSHGDHGSGKNGFVVDHHFEYHYAAFPEVFPSNRYLLLRPVRTSAVSERFPCTAPVGLIQSPF